LLQRQDCLNPLPFWSLRPKKARSNLTCHSCKIEAVKARARTKQRSALQVPALRQTALPSPTKASGGDVRLPQETVCRIPLPGFSASRLL